MTRTILTVDDLKRFSVQCWQWQQQIDGQVEAMERLKIDAIEAANSATGELGRRYVSQYLGKISAAIFENPD